MKKENWVWMPHAGHFMCAYQCRFHLNTYVGKYIVSTIGELWFDRQVREIHASVHDAKWLAKNKRLMGDYFDVAYMKKFGYEEVGFGRKFETMVFKARKGKSKCCPYEIVVKGGDLDFEGYNTPENAYKGHLRLCKKWGNK